MPASSYRDLTVWQRSMELVEAVYKATNQFPAKERFGLTPQLQRAAVSIPSNIAEGHARESSREFLHHLSFAFGSLAELETQVTLAHRLDYLTQAEHDELHALADQVGKMLRNLQSAMRKKVST